MGVASFSLMNADNGQVLLEPLGEGALINLGTLPTRNLNVRANPATSGIGSVVFGFDGNPSYRIETNAPYALAGDTAGTYTAWTPAVGAHSLSATPYSLAGGTGAAGTPLAITFTVLDDPTTPSSGGGGGPPTGGASAGTSGGSSSGHHLCGLGATETGEGAALLFAAILTAVLLLLLRPAEGRQAVQFADEEVAS
jgi:hypothetical protein